MAKSIPFAHPRRTFAATTPVQYDRDPVTDLEFDHDPDRDLCPHGQGIGMPCCDCADRQEFGPNGKPPMRLPTPPDETGPALTASLIHGALVQWGDGNAELEHVAHVIAGAIRLEAERIAHRECCNVAHVVGTTEGLLRIEIAQLRAAVSIQREHIAQLRAVVEGPEVA